MGEAKRRPNRVEEAIAKREEEERQAEIYRLNNPPQPLFNNPKSVASLGLMLGLLGTMSTPTHKRTKRIGVIPWN